MINSYLTYLKAAGQAPSTIEQRRIQLNRIQTFHQGNLTNATKTTLIEFMADEIGHNSPEYRKSMRTALRGFYSWAQQNGHNQTNPAENLPPIKIPRPLPRPVSEEALRTAYDNANDEVKVMILLGAMGGLRLSEITHLHTDDREGNILRVRGKGNKLRIVPLNTTLNAALDRLELNGQSGYYFNNPQTGLPWSISYVGKQLRSLLPKKYAAHSLRHRAASVAYSATKDIRAVQELLGHSSVSTTQLYTAITGDDLKATVGATDWKIAA
jgi:integrase/recombinase XerC